MATYLITGANRGIGLSLAQRLARRGETVIGVCRQSSAALAATGAQVIDSVDMADADAVASLPARLDGQRIDGLVLNAGEALSVGEALAAYSEGGAFAMGHEQRRGRIAVGQFADLAVLDRDILGLAPEEIETTRARLTFVDGEVVFSDGTLTAK